jgi:tripeptidyl-peptidase-1
VESYLSRHSHKFLPGYNIKGRGFPDVAAMGQSYLTFVGGGLYSVSGTSAATPVVAGMISLINAARLKIGLSTLGFVNPLLYQIRDDISLDITVGNNSCGLIAGPGIPCCEQGFPATKGW